MAPIHHVNNDAELETMINNLGGDKCSVVYFFLPWCGSCQKMNPFVDNIAEKNPNTLFFKVDAERSQASSRKHRITKVPIFVLYNNRIRVDRVEGASPMELESKIKRIQADLESKRGSGFNGLNSMSLSQAPGQFQGQSRAPQGPPVIQKMSDISDYLDRRNCRVINDLVPSSLHEFLEGNKLVSGKGVGKLMLMYAFTEKMVIQSFKIKAPIHSGPRVLRFFTNVGGTDINAVNQMNAIQEVMLSEDDLSGLHLIDLRQGGFVGITALQIYIPENQTASRRIEIDHLILNGAPQSLTPFASAGAKAVVGLENYGRMGATGSQQYGGGGGGGNAPKVITANNTNVNTNVNTNNRRH